MREKQPKVIVEVGTWNGVRAQAFLNLAPDAEYHGFDLFEEATPATDKEEMNVKAHYYMEKVAERLTGFKAFLYKGNTRETLPAFAYRLRHAKAAGSDMKKVDFVWLDGGHSVETIRSDWENIKKCLAPDAVVFFDDYYTGPIDTTKYGCNEIVRDLKHEVLPDMDPVAGGGTVQIVRVYP